MSARERAISKLLGDNSSPQKELTAAEKKLIAKENELLLRALQVKRTHAESHCNLYFGNYVVYKYRSPITRVKHWILQTLFPKRNYNIKNRFLK